MPAFKTFAFELTDFLQKLKDVTREREREREREGVKTEREGKGQMRW